MLAELNIKFFQTKNRKKEKKRPFALIPFDFEKPKRKSASKNHSVVNHFRK